MDETAALACGGGQQGGIPRKPADGDAENVALRKVPDRVDGRNAPNIAPAQGVERRENAEQGQVEERQGGHARVAEVQDGEDEGVGQHRHPQGTAPLHGDHEVGAAQELLAHALHHIAEEIEQDHTHGGGRVDR